MSRKQQANPVDVSREALILTIRAAYNHLNQLTTNGVIIWSYNTKNYF